MLTLTTEYAMSMNTDIAGALNKRDANNFRVYLCDVWHKGLDKRDANHAYLQDYRQQLSEAKIVLVDYIICNLSTTTTCIFPNNLYLLMKESLIVMRFNGQNIKN